MRRSGWKRAASRSSPLTGTFAMASAFAVGKQGINVMPILTAQGEARIGTPDGEPDVRMIVGHCTFASSDIELLTSLLPALVYVCGNERLSLFVRLLWEEWRADRPGRDVILQRLLEVLFIEALRCDGGVAARPGLIRGLADPGLARAMRRLHAAPTAPWTVVSLATIAGQSRSVFYERFKQAVGISPMRYLLDWRMTLARNMLRSERVGVAEVAHRVGYRSASTFTAAFTKRVGIPPTTFARNGCMTRGSGGGRQVQRAAAPRRARP